jgi:hypothetical protein
MGAAMLAAADKVDQSRYIIARDGLVLDL